MKEAEQIKLLKQFSSRKSRECELALEQANGGFWEALHLLSSPDIPREALLQKLNPREPDSSAAALEDLQKWFSCEPCLEAWMRIEDEGLQAAYPGDPALPMQEHEFEAVLKMLEGCSGGDLVSCGLEMFYFWEGELPERAVAALLRWTRHYDLRISELALRVFSSFPESVSAGLGLFEEILLRQNDARRYDLSWTLWTLAGQGHHFAELKNGYLNLLRTGSEAEKEFARDLLAGIA